MGVMLHGRYRIAVSTMQNCTGLPLVSGAQALAFWFLFWAVFCWREK